MNAPTRRTRSIAKNVVREAAISDVHCKRDSKQVLRPVFDQIACEADVLLVCGDITHLGLPEEACVFLEQALPVLNKIPVLCVLGNHDFESGRQDALWEQLSGAGLIMMDGDNLEIYGVGFTGVKGFGGGFGRMAIHAMGRAGLKDFVEEAVIEAKGSLKRDFPDWNTVRGLWSCIIRRSDTVAGEPPELFPVLGSSSLEDPLSASPPRSASWTTWMAYAPASRPWLPFSSPSLLI